MLGFPIRTSPDQRFLANSPGLIAGWYVLHRLSMPRHPPCALNNLPTTNHQHTQQTHARRRQLQHKPHKEHTKQSNETTLNKHHTPPPRPPTHTPLNKQESPGRNPNDRVRMLASTIQESNTKKPTSNHHPSPTPRTTPKDRTKSQDQPSNGHLMSQTPNSVPHTPHQHSPQRLPPTREHDHVIPLADTPTGIGTLGQHPGCAP